MTADFAGFNHDMMEELLQIQLTRNGGTSSEKTMLCVHNFQWADHFKFDLCLNSVLPNQFVWSNMLFVWAE